MLGTILMNINRSIGHGYGFGVFVGTSRAGTKDKISHKMAKTFN